MGGFIVAEASNPGILEAKDLWTSSPSYDSVDRG